jgi:hypothetical protein
VWPVQQQSISLSEGARVSVIHIVSAGLQYYGQTAVCADEVKHYAAAGWCCWLVHMLSQDQHHCLHMLYVSMLCMLCHHKHQMLVLSFAQMPSMLSIGGIECTAAS